MKYDELINVLNHEGLSNNLTEGDQTELIEVYGNHSETPLALIDINNEKAFRLINGDAIPAEALKAILLFSQTPIENRFGDIETYNVNVDSNDIAPLELLTTIYQNPETTAENDILNLATKLLQEINDAENEDVTINEGPEPGEEIPADDIMNLNDLPGESNDETNDDNADYAADANANGATAANSDYQQPQNSNHNH